MIRLYHNPRCSKSRAALELLEEAGAQIEVVEYLKHPPSYTELERILSLMHLEPRDLMRKTESDYKELYLDDITLEPEQLIKAMVDNPYLIERPIAVSDNRALLARPPERVLELLA